MDKSQILVINSGSSSIKYQLFDMRGPETIAAGMLEKIGMPGSAHRFWTVQNGVVGQEILQETPIPDHQEGLHQAFLQLERGGVLQDKSQLLGIGHRIVHGGEYFRVPTLINDQTQEAIRATIPLAPLHNPANLSGIEVASELCPDIPQVAVFDTAFHQSMPERAYLYALPYDWYQSHKVRRYGFHGSSHAFVAKRAAVLLGKPLESLNLISLHLGNGCSITAIEKGKSIDTSMGMTPLEGLVMGTRCGDIDPSIPGYITEQSGISIQDVDLILNKESGLKGLCEVSDMREVLRLAELGNHRAVEAFELFCYRIKKYIGAYTAVLGRVDAVIFTGGIGENSVTIRQKVCSGLEGLGIQLDITDNQSAQGSETFIQASGSPVSLLVIPTNEELEIACQTEAVLSNRDQN
jgi:acetate kinase